MNDLYLILNASFWSAFSTVMPDLLGIYPVGNKTTNLTSWKSQAAKVKSALSSCIASAPAAPRELRIRVECLCDSLFQSLTVFSPWHLARSRVSQR